MTERNYACLIVAELGFALEFTSLSGRSSGNVHHMHVM